MGAAQGCACMCVRVTRVSMCCGSACLHSPCPRVCVRVCVYSCPAPRDAVCVSGGLLLSQDPQAALSGQTGYAHVCLCMSVHPSHASCPPWHTCVCMCTPVCVEPQRGAECVASVWHPPPPKPCPCPCPGCGWPCRRRCRRARGAALCVRGVTPSPRLPRAPPCQPLVPPSSPGSPPAWGPPGRSPHIAGGTGQGGTAPQHRPSHWCHPTHREGDAPVGRERG